MRSLVLAGLLNVITLFCFSQTDTEFWFVAPEVANAHGDRPIYLRLTSFDVAAIVTISEPANSSFSNINITIPAFQTSSVNLTSFIDMVENKPSNQVNNYGLHIVSSTPITAYYEEANDYNTDIFTLKGKNSLGTTFYIPSQNDFPNDPRFLAYNSFDIVAAEDNTIVQITPSNDIVGHVKGTTFTIILNKGQTYCAQATNQAAVSHLMGSKVTSNKPIAVTFKDDSVNISGGADLNGDQIIPVDITGKEYVIVRGFIDSSINDRVYVLSTSDQNRIYLNGNSTPVATLNTGNTYSFSISVSNPVAYIVSEKPVYVQHLTGYGFESGSALLPPMKCTGSAIVAFTRSSSNSFTLTIVTSDGAEGFFTLDGNTTLIDPSQFEIVPGSSNPVLKYARITFSTADLPVGSHIISNSSDYFHLGIINASVGNIGCKYGYFSDYTRLNLGPDINLCQGKTAVLDAGPGWDTYLWSTGQITQTISVTSAGTYWVQTSDPSCTLTDTLQVVVSPLPLPTISGPSPGCEGSTGNIYTTESSMSGYTWTVSPGGTITSGSGTNSITVSWNSQGAQTLSVNYINENGCTASSPTVKNVTVNPKPVPTITGLSSVCAGTSGVTYSTESSMSNYTWSVSAGGNITSGLGTNAIVVTWNSAGSQTVDVIYTNGNGCTAFPATEKNVTVIPVNPVDVTITPSANPVCAGTSVQFTAVPVNGGSTPVFQWKVNGVNAGTNSSSFNYTPANNDQVSCVLTSSGGLCITNNPAISNVIHMTVNPVIPVSVSISAASNPVCSGASVQFTAVPVNGGNSPSWQWQVNGVNAGTNSSSFTYIPSNNDQVICILTSSETSCVANNPATSNTVTMTVNPLINVSITVTASSNPVCAGQTVTFTSHPVNQGSTPFYQWKVNGTDMGVNNQVFQYVPANGDVLSCTVTSSLPCVVNNPASGNLSMQVNPLPTANINGTVTVCRNAASPLVTFTGASSTAPYTFTYKINGGANQFVTTTAGNSVSVAAPTNLAGTFIYTLVSVQDGSSTACSQAQTGSATVTVNPLPTASISGTASVCLNASSPQVTFTGASSSAPYTFTYNINGGSAQTITTTSGNSISIAAPTNVLGSFTYNLLSVQDGSATLCSQPQTGSATITVNPLPTATISGTATVCRNAAAPLITFTGASASAPYTFTYNINGGASQFISTSSGNSVTLAAPTSTEGTFVYNLISVKDGSSTSCSQAQSGSATIIVNPLPTATISGTTSVCMNTANPLITFTGASSTAPYTFTYKINGGVNQTVTTTSGNSVSITASTNIAGTFIYSLVSVQDGSATLCSQTQAGTSTITVDPLPTATISGTTSICRNASAPLITFNGASATAPYTFTYNINGGASLFVTTTSGNSVTVAAPTNVVGTFVYNLLSVQDGSSTTCSQAQTGSATVTVKPLPYVTLTACIDTVTTLNARAFLLKGGVPPGGTYSGTGVNSGTGYFDPSIAGTGSKIVTYTYQDHIYYCGDSRSLTINVLPASNLNCGQTFTDARDGKTYPTVLIGTQCWMQKNLDYGMMISSAVHQTDNCTIEKYCYNNIPSNCNIYGGYYQWDEMMKYDNSQGGQGICPPAWHVPSESEWMTLINSNNGNGQAADSLKHTFVTSYNALLAGNLYQNLIWKNFDFATFFWTSSPYSSIRSIARGMNNPDISVSYYPALRSNAFFLRCLKD